MKPRSPTQPGFVLLLTLVVLALAAVVMVDVSRRSVHRAAASIEAGHDLQRRWGVASAHAALLPRIDDVLNDEQARRGQPVTELGATVELGGQRFDLVIADEQAKLNLNALVQEGGLNATARAVSHSIGVTPRNPVVALSPDPRSGRDAYKKAPTAASDIAPFGSWSQVFGDPAPDDLLQVDEDRRRPVEGLTCWGDGRLNVLRASPEVIAGSAGKLLSAGDLRRLLELRQSLIDPQAKLDHASPAEAENSKQSEKKARVLVDEEKSVKQSLLENMDLTDVQREALDGLWVDQSRCQSLTILVADDGRRYRELTIQTRFIQDPQPAGDNAEPRKTAAAEAVIQRFVW